MKKLTDEEKRWALDDAFSCESIDVTIRKFSEITTRREFMEYLKSDLEFYEQYKQAMFDACMFLENDLLNAEKRVGKDAKLARVKADSIAKLLQFRDPQRYGNKIDLKVEQVSLVMALEKSNKRVTEILKSSGVDLPKLQESGAVTEPPKRSRGRPKVNF